MTNYEAMLAAADHIERHPDSFNFFKIRIPTHLNMKGCALGWIGHFTGVSTVDNYASEVAEGFCGDETDFFHAITGFVGPGWMSNPKQCAKGMRLYAEHHLSLEKVPVWARMLDREKQARVDAQPAYERFRAGLALESVPQSAPGNSVPSNAPEDDDEIL